ncbi:PQQ-binding-like beta-propeller repeat protein, partial [Pirellulales bacterium]|nr:PQQ-binding-like beta-propeller repeat protein [Pirellulales bacterium]
MSPEAILPAPNSMRRVWFPFLWIGLLGIACKAAAMRSDDLGRVYFIYKLALALGVVGLAIWVVRSSGWRGSIRWPLAVIPCVTLFAFYTHLLPVEVILDGDAGIVEWRWRWAEPDQHLAVPEAASTATPPWEVTVNDFPAFLGGRAWAEVEHVRLARDWSDTSPRKLWRQPIGAGWSGYAVVGPYAVTQEQRANNELVVCYEVDTGKVVWRQADRVRWDPTGPGALGGIGPRATPTVHEGRVYVHGATGVLSCLDAQTGDVIWSHDTLDEFDAENVMWGKSGSPLIVDDMVVLSVGGANDRSLVAFDQQSGDVVWTAGNRPSSYATPALMTLAGTPQIVCVNE